MAAVPALAMYPPNVRKVPSEESVNAPSPAAVTPKVSPEPLAGMVIC